MTRSRDDAAGAPKESAHWHDLYRSEAAIARRQKLLPKKLARLGVDRAPRSASVVDLCCGEGETLVLLHEMGFRDLRGVDVNISGTLAADARFRTLQADAAETGLPARSADWVLCIHALHHLTTPEKIAAFMTEAHRILKPGGKLAIIDFFDAPQNHVALALLRMKIWRPFPYLSHLSDLIRDEWWYLSSFFGGWPKTRDIIFSTAGFKTTRLRKGLFYFYLVREKVDHS